MSGTAAAFSRLAARMLIQPRSLAPARLRQPASCLSGLVGIPGIGGWQSPPSPRKLEQVVKMELFAGKPADYVARTWQKYHEDESQGRISSVLSSGEYARFKGNAEECPLFVIPLEKPEGYLTLVAQWQGPLALFTTLQEFQNDPASSVAHLTLTHYTEFANSKGLVLVRGDVTTASILNPFEARALTRRFYETYLSPEKYAKWVKPFHQSPASFDFAAYLADLGFK